AGYQEILLHEPKPLAHARGVVRIQHPCQGLGSEFLRHSADEFAVAERLKVEVVRGGRFPETQRVDRLSAVADYRPIVGDADETRWAARDDPQFAGARLERTVELDFDLLMRPGDLPRIGAAQPIIGLLPLPAVLQRLFEDPVFISETVAH